MWDWLNKLIPSNRIKAILAGLLFQYLSTAFPELGITQEFVDKLIVLVLTFIGSETFRSINPEKPGIFDALKQQR